MNTSLALLTMFQESCIRTMCIIPTEEDKANNTISKRRLEFLENKTRLKKKIHFET